MESAHEKHMAAVKRILWYVAGTRRHGLHYTRKKVEPFKLIRYSDTDMAGDIDIQKSTSGVIFFLEDRPITW
jgi:hypothetical protein